MKSEGKPRGSPPKKAEPAYGVDEPYTIFTLVAAGGVAVAAGVLLGTINLVASRIGDALFIVVGLGLGFVFVGFAFGLYLSSTRWKFDELERLTDTIPWGGDETVLDIGCGRGAFSEMAAKRLESGAVVGIDLWRSVDLTGNSPSSFIRNAAILGKGELVFPVKAHPACLPFRDGVFDVAVSGIALNHFEGKENAAEVWRETMRVLKGGGRVALLIGGRTGSYIEVLKEDKTMKDVSIAYSVMGLLPPAHSILARKPYEEALPGSEESFGVT